MHVLKGLVLALCACGSSTASDKPVPANDPSAFTEAQGIELPGDPNGALWDATSRTLYITDDNNDTILRWREREIEPIAKLPPSSGLSGIAQLADGRFVVTAFGFGTNGGIYVVDGEKATPVPNLDPSRRRSGVTVSPDGTIFVAYFIAQPGGVKRGGIARVDLAHGEADVVLASDLIKPVGIVATDATIYVTDQHAPALLAYSRDGAEKQIVTKEITAPDLLTRLPDGALVTGSRDGKIYRIDPKTKTVTELGHGYDAIRGTAYDETNHRLFVIEHGRRRLHILDVK